MSFLSSLGNISTAGLVGQGPFNGFLGTGPGQAGFQQPGMDPVSGEQIASYMNNPQNAQQNQQAIMAGTQGANQIAAQSTNQQNQANELGGGGMPGMGQAVSARAAKNFSVQGAKLNQQMQLPAAEMSNNQFAAPANASIAYMNAQNNIEKQTNDLALAQNAATYQVISQFMIGAGKFGGQMAAGDGTTNNNPDYSVTGGGEESSADSASIDSAGESGLDAAALA